MEETIVDLTCVVCRTPAAADASGLILVEGITDGRTRDWMWGPMVVCDFHRTQIRTPYDEQLGSGEYIAAWHRVRLDVVQVHGMAVALEQASAARCAPCDGDA